MEFAAAAVREIELTNPGVGGPLVAFRRVPFLGCTEYSARELLLDLFFVRVPNPVNRKFSEQNAVSDQRIAGFKGFGAV